MRGAKPASTGVWKTWFVRLLSLLTLIAWETPRMSHLLQRGLESGYVRLGRIAARERKLRRPQGRCMISPQSRNASITGNAALPRLDSLYSTRGGTSA